MKCLLPPGNQIAQFDALRNDDVGVCDMHLQTVSYLLCCGVQQNSVVHHFDDCRVDVALRVRQRRVVVDAIEPRVQLVAQVLSEDLALVPAGVHLSMAALVRDLVPILTALHPLGKRPVGALLCRCLSRSQCHCGP